MEEHNVNSPAPFDLKSGVVRDVDKLRNTADLISSPRSSNLEIFFMLGPPLQHWMAAILIADISEAIWKWQLELQKAKWKVRYNVAKDFELCGEIIDVEKMGGGEGASKKKFMLVLES